MDFLKKKSVRTAAVIAAFMVFVSAVYVLLDNALMMKKVSDRRYDIYFGRAESEVEFREIDGWAWKAANLYMKSTDLESGSRLKKSLEDGMKKIGLTDSNGRLILPESENYYYNIVMDVKNYSNNEKIFSGGYDDRYMYEAICNLDSRKVISMPEYREEYYSCNRCYTNNAGMYYYYIDGAALAVYSYDTSGLESYIDNYGAVIYLNSDGTSPVPYIYNDGYTYESFDAENPLSESEMTIRFSNAARINIIPLQKHIDEYENYAAYRQAAESKRVKNMALFVSLAAAAGLLSLYIVIMGGYDEKSERFVLRFHDRIFGEFYIILLSVLPYVVDYMEPHRIYYNFLESGLSETSVQVGWAVAVGLVYLTIMFSVDSILNRLKCGNIKDTFLTTKIISNIYRRTKDKIITFEMLKNDIFTRRFLIRLLAAMASGIAAVVIGIYTVSLFIIIAAAVIITIAYIFTSLRDLRALNELYDDISRISCGNYMPCIEDKNKVTYGATVKLNRISDGIQRAVDEQLRSERMKIDLVTNVSHDLKTPLTSVISYVDLLSKEELPPEASDYVAVLEQKTARLKSIVSDVFDLAKATSNTDVNIEKIDAVILVNQVLADMQDKVEKYEREIKTDICAESAFIMAEGKKMYRVVQNIFDNALKYSMSGTRIFAKLYTENGRVRFRVKNTSAYEMNFTPEEITERFTRGDKARTTEGSGLGLSIARSFTEACGGNFSVSIDGDVFIADIDFEKTE